jgi:cell shape-determining protein MreC
MKTLHSFTARPQRSSRRTLVITTLIVGLLVLGNYLSGDFLRTQMRYLLLPISSSTATLAYRIFQGDTWSSRATLQTENAQLRAQLATLRSHDILFQSLVQENQHYAEALRMASSSLRVGARVISNPSSSPFGTININAGSSQGVVKGDIVLTSDGFVLGTVAEVSNQSALVDLILAPRRIVSATINGIPFALSGRGGSNGSGIIPRGSVVHTGDIVTVPEFEGRTVGVVDSVRADSTSADSMVYIAAPFNLSAAMLVVVVHHP